MTNASDGLPINSMPVKSGALQSAKKASSISRWLAGFVLVLLATNVVQAAPFAYITNSSDDTVLVIDLSTNAAVATITVGTDPIGIAINPAGSTAYVTNFDDNTVSVINTASNTVTTTVAVGTDPQLLAVSPDGSSVYVANLQSTNVSVIDTATNAVTEIAVGGFPVGVAFSPAGDRAYVTEANLSQLVVIDTASKAVVTTIPVGANPLGVVVTPSGKNVYVANYFDGTVSVIDTTSNQVTATVVVGDGPDGIAINPAGTFVYAVNHNSASVSVIDTTTNTVVTALPVGNFPLGIALDSTGTYAYVTNSFDDTLSIIDLSANITLGTLGTGVTPSFVAVTSSAALSVNLDQHGLTGSWYEPATSGQGFMIEVYPDVNGAGQGVLSAGWFTFDVTASGGKRWYTLQGNVSNTDPLAALTIYTATGGNFNAAPIVSATAVGQATLTFTDCTHGLLNYTFNDGSNRTGSIPLSRITANTTCSAGGDNGAPASDYLLSGAWYNPVTSGQGLIFDVNPAQSVLSAAWYTYAPTGQMIGGGASQSWYSIQTSSFVSGLTSATGIPIYETTGGVFHDPTTAKTTQVGTANIAFMDCNTATLGYVFTAGTNQGLNGSINLVRLGPTPAGCTL